MGIQKDELLCPMNRQQVHFVAGVDAAADFCLSCVFTDVSLVLNLERALADGFQFFKAANGVVLGGVGQSIPLSYLQKSVEVAETLKKKKMESQRQMEGSTLGFQRSFPFNRNRACGLCCAWQRWLLIKASGYFGTRHITSD